MKYMIASDIHGSAYYCEKMLEALEKEKADRLVLLGDLLYHGPRNDLPREYAPKKVIAMLNAQKDRIYSVRGNCDAEVDQMVLEFPVLADYCILDVDGILIYCSHGHVYNEDHLPPMRKGDVFSPWTHPCAEGPAAGELHDSQPRLRGPAQGGKYPHLRGAGGRRVHRPGL